MFIRLTALHGPAGNRTKIPIVINTDHIVYVAPKGQGAYIHTVRKELDTEVADSFDSITNSIAK